VCIFMTVETIVDVGNWVSMLLSRYSGQIQGVELQYILDAFVIIVERSCML
jgi:hypothetical protein